MIIYVLVNSVNDKEIPFIHWRRKWQPTPVFLLGKSHGQRSLAGYSSWGHKESDMQEQLSTTLHLESKMAY